MTPLVFLAILNIPILLYLCFVNFRILKYEIRIHEVEVKLLEVSHRLLEATKKLEEKV